MGKNDSLLDALGISLVDPNENPETYAGLFRTARRLRAAHKPAIGLVPANDGVAVPPVAVQLAFVLADLCSGGVAFVDANTMAPALSTLLEGKSVMASGFQQIALSEQVTALTWAGVKSGRLELTALRETLALLREQAAHVLVDLTGFGAVGEQWRAFDMVDGVLVIARAGATTEGELVEGQSDVPGNKALGVLLVG